MLLLKYLLLGAGIAMLLIAAAILTYDICLLVAGCRRLPPHPVARGLAPELPPRWRASVAFVMLAWAPLLISASFVLVPSGITNVRVGQTVSQTVGQPKAFSPQQATRDKVFSAN